jgi:hypothetical protein
MPMSISEYAGWVAAGTLGLVAATGVACADAPSPTDPATESVNLDDRRPLRLALRKVMHGEFVVETRSGSRDVLIQRGTVMSIGGSEPGVMSSDGFTIEWLVTDATRVHRHGDESALHEVDSGDSVWVIGAKTGEAGGTARAIRTAER